MQILMDERMEGTEEWAPPPTLPIPMGPPISFEKLAYFRFRRMSPAEERNVSSGPPPLSVSFNLFSLMLPGN